MEQEQRYTKEDFHAIGDIVEEMYSPKQPEQEVVNEEEFYDVEDEAERMDGDLDYNPESLPLDENEMQELYSLASDYHSVKSNSLKERIKKDIDGYLNKLMNRSSDESFEQAVSIRDEINHIMAVGNIEDEEFDAENDFERRREQMGRERGY